MTVVVISDGMATLTLNFGSETVKALHVENVMSTILCALAGESGDEELDTAFRAALTSGGLTF